MQRKTPCITGSPPARPALRRWIAGVLPVLLVLSGCATRRAAAENDPIPAEAPVQSPASQIEEARVPERETAEPQAAQPRYIDRVVEETVARFAQPDMGEYELAKAAFDYLVETTTLVDPVGLDIWRIREDGGEPPSFVENRSLSVLLFHIGKCEDYAAALTMLLRGAGLEAVYVPGLTYSSQGELVDHAWTIAKIDGAWYHLDCQLEQNISRHGSMRYKYFMRGDATMAGSHRWGQNLIQSGLLTEEQNGEIARDYIPPACEQDYPTPARQAVALPADPDVGAIQAEIEAEFRAYEDEHGPLEPLELNTIPPVFALDGYGPQD